MQRITKQNYKKLLKRKNIDVDVKIKFKKGSETDFDSITFYFQNGVGDVKKLFIDKLNPIELCLDDLDAIVLQPQSIISKTTSKLFKE